MATPDSHSGASASDLPPSQSPILFTCIAGPDRGKRFAVRTQPLLLGQSSPALVVIDRHGVVRRAMRGSGEKSGGRL